MCHIILWRYYKPPRHIAAVSVCPIEGCKSLLTPQQNGDSPLDIEQLRFVDGMSADSRGPVWP
jgi:hypothetical protein